ncbi:spore protease YyaC [Xylanibacillus composti]|uniref:Sporulation protein YyaC n=1 Tax=Xylanibacillus composti TaxID=1572762 RepID=A0A8J4H5G9_9BACL|nr:spore protease YyaC [Xylanibacillus composti]MDT9725196.1 spore protease YyaC [Xylanibacillus composti]GIQ70046.1 hypothetical protein XYCOK13_28700 [Xylanibacillus composti]
MGNPFPFMKRLKATPDSIKLSYQEADIHEKLALHLSQFYSRLEPEQDLVAVCVGTDRSTGDSLGPFVGTQLNKQSIDGLYVYGTLDEPVHAMNLQDTLDRVSNERTNPFIIAVDACLGQVSSVGCIQIGDGPVKPGAGVNKDLPPVGNVHITGIVNVGGFMEYFVLQNTRLSLVIRMAEIIGHSIVQSLAYLPDQRASI